MNLPNKITMIRILMIPFILLFILPVSFISSDSAWNSFIFDYGIIISTFLFLLASLTDTMDGQIARKRGIVTNMGKFLDPIADKLLVTSVLIALVQRNEISAIIAIIIISREFIVTGIRLLAADKKVVLAAGNLGKIKTVMQIIAIIVIMLGMQFKIMFPDFELIPAIEIFSQTVLWVAVGLTVVSGYDYMKKNMSFIKE